MKRRLSNLRAILSEILSHTIKVGNCLEWQRCFNSDGYPRAVIDGDSNTKVHRKVFELVNGFKPPVVRHTCDNIKCINPDHLLPGTPSENTKDRDTRGRTHNYLPPEERDLILSLRAEGLSYKEIARQLNCSVKRVDTTLYRFRRVAKFAE